MNRFEKVTYLVYKNSINSDCYDCDIQQEYNDIKLPKRGSTGSAGYDFFAPFSLDLEPNETIVIPTGIRWVCDDSIIEEVIGSGGYQKTIIHNAKVLKIYPRSGLGFKYQLGLANTVGIIDMDFCKSDDGGHIKVKLVNNGNIPVHIEKGKGFVQGIIEQYFITEDDNVSSIRNGGFGSTDRR